MLIGVDYLFNLVYPLRPGETDEVNRFNAELHRAHPWIIPFGGLHVEDEDKGAIVDLGPRSERFWPDFTARLPKKPRAS